jgi:hypothetical protein
MAQAASIRFEESKCYGLHVASADEAMFSRILGGSDIVFPPVAAPQNVMFDYPFQHEVIFQFTTSSTDGMTRRAPPAAPHRTHCIYRPHLGYP